MTSRRLRLSRWLQDGGSSMECFSTLYKPQTNRCFRQAQQSATKPQQCANSAGEGSFPTHRSQPRHQTVTLVGVFEPKSDMHDILTVPGLRNWCCNCTVQSLILGRAHQRTGTLHNTPCFCSLVQCFSRSPTRRAGSKQDPRIVSMSAGRCVHMVTRWRSWDTGVRRNDA